METPKCPYEGFYQFRSRTNEFQTLVDFFSSHGDETGFRSATSIVSLGAGDGTLDCDLIRKSLPALRSYTGLECDAKNYEHLENKLTGCSKQLAADRDGLTLTPLLAYVEDYSGPEEPVDVVMMMHFLYYLRKRKGEMIKRAFGWLKPGGRLVIGVVGHDDILQKLANIGASDLVSWPSRTTTELRALGLSYKEFNVEHKFSYTGCDKKFADFVLEKATSETEAADILQGLPTLAVPGTNTILHGTHVFVVEKT